MRATVWVTVVGDVGVSKMRALPCDSLPSNRPEKVIGVNPLVLPVVRSVINSVRVKVASLKIAGFVLMSVALEAQVEILVAIRVESPSNLLGDWLLRVI